MYAQTIPHACKYADEVELAQLIAEEVAARYHVPVSQLYAADHTLEGLAPGDAVVTWEGWAGAWTAQFAEQFVSTEVLRVTIEPLSDYSLAIYPKAS